MKSERQTVLVTGGAGFIGCNFVRFLRAERPDWHIVNYDALTYAGNPANVADLADDDHHTFVHADIRDRGTLVGALRGCRAVVHFAAESHVDRSINDSGPFVSTNVVGTQILLDACRDVGSVERFVHIGTDEVYGSLPLDRPDLKFAEDSPLRPNSPYAASKAAADLLALAYHETYGMPILVSRCSNNFGPYQYPEKIIPLFVTNLFDGKPVPLYGDGLNVRDWLHVTDHCQAVLRILEDGRAGAIYNIGGDNEQSNLELTRTILDLLGFGEEMIQPVADRPGHDRRYAIDASKIRRELGWKPTRSAWPDALADSIQWYRANEDWWRPLQANAFNATMLPDTARDPLSQASRGT
ncbi:MAG: dTDP-glucose 4,6-dehydratase [Planctomycetota bacterium]|jgi:dTDP-glucose 4,6-dehydratase